MTVIIRGAAHNLTGPKAHFCCELAEAGRCLIEMGLLVINYLIKEGINSSPQCLASTTGYGPAIKFNNFVCVFLMR